jgi:Novel STAND NTPase 1
MRRIDIFVSSPEDVRAERILVERSIRSIAAEFSVPITVTYSNWLRRLSAEDKVAAQSVNGRDEGRSWLCPCFWEYQDFGLDQDYRERIPNTGSYDLVISILWSRLGTKISPAFVMPDGSRPQTVNEYEIAWVLDQLNRTPGFPELRVYRNRSTPPAPPQPKEDRETFFRQWDAVQEFYAAWEKEGAFTEACSDYSNLQDFENLFRDHFRDFLARQLKKEVVTREPPLRARYWKSNPFRGMLLFDFEHAPVFHGRTKAVGEVLDALKKQASAKKPFVLVLGASGSGKSSLVRAGVLPLLTEIGTVVGDGPWRRAVTRPGPGGTSGDPFDALAVALLGKGALPELAKAASRNEWRKLAAELREHPDSVVLRVKELLDRISLQELDHLLHEQDAQSPLPGRIESVELARHRRLRRVKPKAQLALVIDQLEDLFASGFSRELQQRYIALLAALVRCQRVFVIAALRSDFYASYLQFPELVALVAPSGRFDLLPPTRSELRSIIRLPAEAAGLSFERDIKENGALDEALTDAAVACAEPLPLLEHLLSQLYRKQLDRRDGLLRWSDYRELGEFEGALANHAESVFTALNSDAQQTFEFVMRQLVLLGPDDKALCRQMPYQILVSSRELDNRLKMGAKSLVDCLVKEGLFHAEPDPKQEVFISVAHPALLRSWPRVQQWLAEDQEFLRMRDRLDGCLKLWLNRGRQNHRLLRPGSGLADGETLINHFHFSLSEAQIGYIEKSIAAQRRGRRIRNIVALPVLIALASLAAVVGVRWLNTESQRKSLDEYTNLERRIAEIAQSKLDATQNATKSAEERAQRAEQRADLAATQLRSIEARLKQAEENAQQKADTAASELGSAQTEMKKAEENAQLAQQSADLATTERTAMEAQLKQAEAKAQQSADLTTTQRTAMEAQLKQAEQKAQLAQQSADLATSQRTAMEAQLKQAEQKAQLAQQSADLATSQRTAMEAQLKQAEAKAQQSADLATTQRTAMEAQLKQAEQKAQLAQQSADLATSQRSAMEAQLKNAQLAQQSTDLAVTQRGAMEVQLKKAEENAQAAQQSADLATIQRTAMEAQLKQAEAKAQQSADFAATQRSAMEAQLKQAEEKAQVAQQSADLATTQRSAMEAQLKKAEVNAQVAQQSADLATTQRSAMEAQLKKAEEKAQLTQQSADLATTQRSAMEAQLKKAEEKAQLAQQSADLATTQRSAMEAQLKKAEEKAQLAQQSADLAVTQRSAMGDELKQAQAKARVAQQSADLASTERSAMEVELKRAEEKARLAQKIADLASAESQAVETGSSKGEPVKNSADLPANQLRSGRALPLDAGQNAEPVPSTQPLLPPVQSGGH